MVQDEAEHRIDGHDTIGGGWSGAVPRGLLHRLLIIADGGTL